VIGLVAVAAAALASAATAGTETAVSAFGCASGGGAVTVPAGSQVVVRQGWASGNVGLVRDFVNAQTTTVSLNGGAPVDVSNLWSTPAPVAAGAVSFVSYDTGTTLAAGESLTFRLTTTLAHPVLDKEPGGAVRVTGTPIDATCTVTAV